MDCKNCKKQGCSLAGKSHEMSFECRMYVGKTNADRIRAMTDEELARLPMKYNIDCICCPLYEGCDFKAGLCSEQWLAYLKQEATND